MFGRFCGREHAQNLGHQRCDDTENDHAGGWLVFKLVQWRYVWLKRAII